MISVSDVTKVHKDGTIANDHISIHVAKADIVGLIGSNGAGKTTLIRQIVGLSKPTSGTITIGECLQHKNIKETAMQIAFFNQKTILLEAHTAFEVIYYTGIYRGLGKAEAKEQTNELLAYFDITEAAKKRLTYMSGGQTKLVMLACAFIGKYPIIILDEPTNDLDPINRHRLWFLVNRFNSVLGSTFIIASHNLSELETVARTIAIIRKGKIVDYGDIQSLKKKYSKGYRVSIQCEYGDIKALIAEIAYPYEIENQNEIIIAVEEEKLTEVSQAVLSIISKYNAEMKIYRGTLSNIYQSVQEENENV